MPQTYIPLATTTLNSTASSVTFSSISSSYTDLVLSCAIATSSGGWAKLQFNSDTGTNYSVTLLEGDGALAYSARYSTQDHITIAGRNSLNIGANLAPTLININIQNYSNTTTYKSALARSNTQASSTLFSSYSYIGLWRSTSVITSIILSLSTGNWNSGSTFTLYGIKSA